jgi:cellulose synthase/poly-beta-1,6-N-acetylglucosamine synthase-like glycosyltransferase
MDSSLPSVSLIIPAYNAARWIVECLESVRALEYPSEKLEVLVVDNKSTDGTGGLAHQCGFEPVVCERPGASAARNLGLSRAAGAIAAFLDSDAVADPGWLIHLVQSFQDPDVVGVGGRIDPYRVVTGSEWHAVLCRLLDQEKHLEGDPPFLLPFVATANAAFRTNALRAVGGFDENLAVCEDADLCWRLQWAGGKIIYADSARVKHHHRSSRKEYFRQTFNYGQGTVRLFAKHRRRLHRRVWIEWRHFGAILRAVARAPVMPFLARRRLHRFMPFYDVVSGLCWTAGRIAESFKRRVIVI